MMIRCPSCTERLEYHDQDLQAGGGLIRCRSCGHDWLEGKVIEVSPETKRPVQVPFETANMSDGVIHNLVSASLLAQEAFQLKRRRRRMAVAAWASLVLIAIMPAALAVAIPERVVAAAPASIALYEWLGREVNVYGLEIRKIELQHLQSRDQKIIAVKGEVVNVSSSDRKVPWLRFGLKSDTDKEVYQWNLDTESRPLRPGEARSFVTRIASPPESASTVEIRFARADEIGANAGP